jgi:hypothetical protein
MAKEIKTDKDTKLHKVCSIEIDINTQMKIMSPRSSITDNTPLNSNSKKLQ